MKLLLLPCFCLLISTASLWGAKPQETSGEAVKLFTGLEEASTQFDDWVKSHVFIDDLELSRWRNTFSQLDLAVIRLQKQNRAGQLLAHITTNLINIKLDQIKRLGDASSRKRKPDDVARLAKKQLFDSNMQLGKLIVNQVIPLTESIDLSQAPQLHARIEATEEQSKKLLEQAKTIENNISFIQHQTDQTNMQVAVDDLRAMCSSELTSLLREAKEMLKQAESQGQASPALDQLSRSLQTIASR